MFQYRQVLVRLRQGDSDRDVARAGLMGRPKVAARPPPRRNITRMGHEETRRKRRVSFCPQAWTDTGATLSMA